MGPVTAKLQLKSPHLAPVEVDTLADTGSLHLCIPEHIRIQLGLPEIDRRRPRQAPRALGRAPLGPLQEPGRFRRRPGAGDQTLLGAIPLEDMDLLLIPHPRTIDVNPSSPNIATSIVK